MGDDALTQSYPNPPPPPPLNLPEPPKLAMRKVVGVQELFLTFPHAGSKAGHLGDDALAVPELSGGPWRYSGDDVGRLFYDACLARSPTYVAS